jgi:leucyl aminopeptidase
MKFNIKKVHSLEGMPSIIVLADKPESLPTDLFTVEEIEYISNQHAVLKKCQFEFNKLNRWIFVQLLNLEEHTPHKRAESLRKAGNILASALNEQKSATVTIIDCLTSSFAAFYLLEGLALGNYQFLKYQTNAVEKQNTLLDANIISTLIKQELIDQLNCVIEAVWMARDLVNEPGSTLTATLLA